MDAGQLKQSLMTLHWSTMTLADILRCPTDVVMAWYYGYDAIPPTVAEWLERLVVAHDRNPPPAGGLTLGQLENSDAGDDSID